MYRRTVASHQVRDGAVDQALALQDVLALKGCRLYFDCEVATAATNFYLRTRNCVADRFVNRVGNGAFEGRQVNRHAPLIVHIPGQS